MEEIDTTREQYREPGTDHVDPTVAAIVERIEGLTTTLVRLIKMADDAIELLTRVADTLPQSCQCNYEHVEGRTAGTTCLPHQAEAFLATLRK